MTPGMWAWTIFIVFTLVVLPILNGLFGRRKRRAHAEMEKYLQSITLQRTTKDVVGQIKDEDPYRFKTGVAWEQDAPYPECFEEDDL